MALLTSIQLAAALSRYELRLDTPAQAVYVSPTTGKRYVHERSGYYRFVGVVEIPIQPVSYTHLTLPTKA